MEIERLHKMLLDAGIEHDWCDRTPPGYNKWHERYPDWLGEKKNWGWQIRMYSPNRKQVISAIEGFGSCCYDADLIEIMGLLTPEEKEYSRVVGWLTAEDVFERIVRAVNDA